MEDLGDNDQSYKYLGPRIVVLDALLGELESGSYSPRSPVLLQDPPRPHGTETETQTHSPGDGGETQPPPPAYTPQQTVKGAKASVPTHNKYGLREKDVLYSTVIKPPKEMPQPSKSTMVASGLCELDRLLQELNAAQFSLTDEILAQFPLDGLKDAEGEGEREVRPPGRETDKRAPPVNKSATSATRELDKLMASLSEFKLNKTPSPELSLSPSPGIVAPCLALERESEGGERGDEGGRERAGESAERGNEAGERAGKAAERGSEAGERAGKAAERGNEAGERAGKAAERGSEAGERAGKAAERGNETGEREREREREAGLELMLGLLKTDLGNRGIDTESKGVCAACHKQIVGQMVTGLGQTWHIDHFCCSHCGTEIRGGTYFENDGRAFCERDYWHLFSPRCARCQLPITDKMVTALGQNWHPNHFCCAECGCTFGDEGFREREGFAYCLADYSRLFAVLCAGCEAPILQSFISALNRVWHPDCFVCQECLSPFQSGSFYEHEGRPYCETHYHQSRGSVCSGCSQPIAGRCVTAMGVRFHPQHFTCAFCQKPLSKGAFREHQDSPYCQPCFSKLFG